MLLLLLACGHGPDTATADPAPEPTLPDAAAEVLPGGAEDWLPCEEAPALFLNEAVSANVEGLVDADGDTSDWIELRAEEAVDLSGWSIGTSADTTWPFPALSLALGDTPVIFASGKDRADPGELHTDFKLDALGEEVFLVAPEGCVADHLETGRLYADVSVGRASDGSLGYFLEPTPGAPNTTESRPGFAEAPSLSPAGGPGTDIEVTVTGDGVLTLTRDGSVPTETGEPYTAPLAIDGLMVVRARAFVDGLWPSPIATGTYIEDGEVFDKGLMVVSLVVDPPDLWDEDTGIYAYGTEYEASYPYFGANFWEPWERDVHVEIWEADGTPQITQDAGIQIAGGYSRCFDQRNFELLARSGYGPDTFDAPVFPQEELTSYRHLYLRNGGDWCGTQLIDGTVQALFRDKSGQRYAATDLQAYRPVMVYLNGEFWGVYELKERLDEYWIADHRGEGPEDLDRVKVGWTHEANWTVDQGDWVAFDELDSFWQTHDLSDADAWAEFEAQVDVENFASSIVVQGWIGNSDWWVNNLRMWRPRRDDGRWRWMSYDFGHGWNVPTYDHLATSIVTDAKGLPIAAALENESFRELFLDTHADYLNTTLEGGYAASVVEELDAAQRPAMQMQLDRWCGGTPLSTYDASIDFAVGYAEQRAGNMGVQLVDHFGVAGRPLLRLDAEPQEGGHFDLTVVSVEAPFEGRYFEDVPVTVTAVAEEGYTFVGWSDPELGTEPVVTLPMAGDTELVARFE